MNLRNHPMYTWKRTSQCHEDGILFALNEALDLQDRDRATAKKKCVEFGGGDGWTLSNTAALIDAGWGGVFIEADPDLAAAATGHYAGRPDVSVICDHIKRSNVNWLVPADVALASIDIDGNDYWVWKRMKARPDIVIIEYNSNFAPDVWAVMPYTPDYEWKRGDCYGASSLAMTMLGAKLGYRLVDVVVGLNLVFLKESLLPELPTYDHLSIPFVRSHESVDDTMLVRRIENPRKLQ